MTKARSPGEHEPLCEPILLTHTSAPTQRVLVITRNLPPLIGGMERLLRNVVRELSSGFEVTVIGPKGCAKELPEVESIREIPPYPLWRFLLASLRAGIQLGRRLRPQIVFAGSGLTAPVALMVARLTGAVAVSQLHGLDLVARNLIYRIFFVSTLPALDAVVVNSRHTASLATRKRIKQSRIFIVHPGIELPEPATRAELERFVASHDLKGKRILLFVGRITERKGLSYFVKYSLPEIVRRHSNTVLVVVGTSPKDALKSDDTEIENVKQAIESAGMPDHVRLMGGISDELCHLCYLSSEVFVFPAISLIGDVEGFGMVAIEAAARGLPTVAFAVDGIVDAVDDGYSGYLIQPGAHTEFTAKVLQLLDSSDSTLSNNCIRHAQKFCISAFGSNLRGTLTKVLERKSIEK